MDDDNKTINQKNNASPSSLIGKRFGGFRDDMGKHGNTENMKTQKYESAKTQSVETTRRDLQDGSEKIKERETAGMSLEPGGASSNDDLEEYKKIIDTRTIEEIEAENERMEEYVKKAENELKGGVVLPELEPVKEEIELPSGQDIELESGPAVVQLAQDSKEVREDRLVEAPEQDMLEMEVSEQQDNNEVNNLEQEELDDMEDVEQVETQEDEQMVDQESEEFAGFEEQVVSTMPVRSRFKFKDLRWYWHVVYRHALGLGIFLVMVYLIKEMFEFSTLAWFALDLLSVIFSVYIFYLIASRVIKVRREAKAQALVAGFVTGLIVGWVVAMFRLIYVWEVWTLTNLFAEPILTGLIGGLASGFFALFIKTPVNLRFKNK